MKRLLLTCLQVILVFVLGWAQQTVTGTVNDDAGEPLIGANVLLKGTSTGTVTDVDGSFTIEVPGSNSILEFSYIGYQTQDVALGNQTQLSVVLLPDYASLEEVVVVGYGTQQKRDVTAAISSIKGDKLKAIPVSNTVAALQGQVPGVDVVSTGGRPGEAGRILIRGRRSINASNDPLVVLDGIPLVNGGTAFNINPNDIASVEVLKDAAATSIYGSRGANGVILINTKRGTSDRISVSYDGFHGVSSVANQVDMMDGTEFANMKRESRRRTSDGKFSPFGTIPSDNLVFEDQTEFESIQQGRSTNYQDLVFSQGYSTNHQVSISGGTEKTRVLLSAGYFQEQGIFSTQDFTRYSFRLNVDQQIAKNIRVGGNIYLSRAVQNFASNPLGEALANNPLGVPYDENGNLRFLPINDGIRTNPLNELVPNAHLDERRFINITPNMYLEYEPIKNLRYRMTLGPELEQFRRGLYTGPLTNARRGAPPVAGRENRQDFSFTMENLITYDFSLGGDKHRFKLTALQSTQTWDSDRDNITVLNLPYETQLFNNLGTAEAVTNFGSRLEEWQLLSYMGRINYDLAGKYLFQVSARADGSSRLADGNRWTVFPGASIGWRVTEEPFMENVNFFDDWKIRASYGTVGNTSISPYQTQGRLARTTYVFGNTAAFGYRLNEIPNPDLGWEQTSTIDIGTDFSFLKGKIGGSIDFYQSQTNELLLRRQLPPTSGYTQILQNVGKTQNTGLEINLNLVPVETQSGFTWSLDVNWSRYKEEILQLFNGEDDDVGNRWFIGQPLTVFYDYNNIGIWNWTKRIRLLNTALFPVKSSSRMSITTANLTVMTASSWVRMCPISSPV